MCEVLDAKEEFRNFFILLSQDKWFTRISNYRELEKINGTCNKTDNNNWEYSISKFEFKNINIERHTRPMFVNKLYKDGSGISKLLLSVSCKCLTSIPLKDIDDPIKELATKFIVQFEYLSDADDVKVIQSSWHLDKHDAAKKTNSSHPIYHYEFGGTEITKTEDFNFGDFFLIDAPRIMHPPMDIVLSIDFIIKNYYKYEDHKNLTDDKRYKKFIKSAQCRIWRPYAILLASHFHDFQEDYKIDIKAAQNILHCE